MDTGKENIGKGNEVEISMDEFRLDKIDKIKDKGALFSILVSIVEKLRSPEGCLWDREQDHTSLKRSLLEEAYEVVENIESNSPEGLKEELGDLLLQVVFHSQIAAERGTFDIVQVLKSIISKLIRRHPHVFEGKTVESCNEILSNWEDIKKKEREGKHKGTSSIFSDIPNILPSLHYAYEIQARASRVGFDWDSPEEVFKKIKEEIKELCAELNKLGCIEKKGSGVINEGNSKRIARDNDKIKDEIGDILFSIVNFCRHIGIDSEECLKKTCKKFIKRFDFMEEYAQTRSLDLKKLSLEEKDRLWEISKKFI